MEIGDFRPDSTLDYQYHRKRYLLSINVLPRHSFMVAACLTSAME